MSRFPTSMNGQDARGFLGRGWSFPLSLVRGGVALVEEGEDIKQSIQIILGTSPGERVMRPDFGTPLRQLAFEPLNFTTCEIAKSRVEDALRRWEPRIDVQSVVVKIGDAGTESFQGAQSATLSIAIRYVIRSTNTETNIVYPYYLNEVHR